MTEPPAIAFDAVSKTFGDGRQVLDGVSLAVPPGEFVAVVGASGAGKTTLLRLINRLADPTAGTVQVDGEDVQATDPIALRRRIGYVFQGIGLFPHMTVAREHRGDAQAARVGRGPHRATRVDGAARGWSPRPRPGTATAFRTSSRAANVSASASPARSRPGPRIVLMDEPFGALDPLTRDALASDYRGLHEKLGLTTVMITHDLDEALLIADRIVVLSDGRVVADAAPHALMTGRADRLRARPDRGAAPPGRAPARAGGRRTAMNLLADGRIADALARLPDYLGSHVKVSMTALALGLGLSIPLALAAMRRPVLRRRAPRRRKRRADDPRASPCWRCSIPLLLGLAALSERLFGVRLLGPRLPAVGAGARALQHAAGAAERGHRPRRHRSGRASEAAVGVGMTPRQSLLDGRAAARPAGDHGRRPHRRRLGDRHRDAVDADRPDQPRQLHLHRPADAELGVRAVRLRLRRRCSRSSSTSCWRLMESGLRDRRARAGRGRVRRLALVVAGALVPGLSRPHGHLRDRRQAVHRAVRPRRPDRAAAARRRPDGATGVTDSARPSSSLRSRPARSTSTSTIPARSGRTSSSATTYGRARRCWPRSTRSLQARAWHHRAGRARLRERLCAGDAAHARRGARHPLDRRPRPPRAAISRSPATTSSSAGRNGRR